jgi:chromosome segregation ATPase
MSLRFQQQDLNLKKSFEGISGQFDEVNEQIDDLKSDIRSLNSNLKDMRAKLAEKDTLIESLAKRLSVLEAASNIVPVKKAVVKKAVAEDEADVDMGALFGDDY